jgi:hypothetical protein
MLTLVGQRRPKLALVLGGIGLAGLAVIGAFLMYVPSLLAAGALSNQAEMLWYSLSDSVRTLFLYHLLTTGATVLSFLVLIGVFWVWCRPLTQGAVIPRRSYIAVLICGVLSLVWYVRGWPYGLQYQGSFWVTLNALLSLSCLCGLAAIAVSFNRTGRSSWWRAYAFHWLLFGWALTFAFPWLGETW